MNFTFVDICLMCLSHNLKMFKTNMRRIAQSSFLKVTSNISWTSLQRLSNESDFQQLKCVKSVKMKLFNTCNLFVLN